MQILQQIPPCPFPLQKGKICCLFAVDFTLWNGKGIKSANVKAFGNPPHMYCTLLWILNTESRGK